MTVPLTSHYTNQPAQVKILKWAKFWFGLEQIYNNILFRRSKKTRNHALFPVFPLFFLPNDLGPTIKILENEEVNGLDFLDLTEEKLERHGMKMGPAMRLVKFAKECKDEKLRAFSSYGTGKDLSNVLAKYGVDGNGLENIISKFLIFCIHIDNSYH